jgi:hypothetical protein
VVVVVVVVAVVVKNNNCNSSDSSNKTKTKNNTVTAIILPELQISTPNHGNEVDLMSADTGHHRSPVSSPYRTAPMFPGVLH